MQASLLQELLALKEHSTNQSEWLLAAGRKQVRARRFGDSAHFLSGNAIRCSQTDSGSDWPVALIRNYSPTTLLG